MGLRLEVTFERKLRALTSTPIFGGAQPWDLAGKHFMM